MREELGRKIRKAFLPSNDVLLSADYSQVELRVMASLSKCPSLIDAFNNDEDIHTHVAGEVFGVPEEAVTKTMRRCAKAVIFGIIYGISGFGLGENLHISKKMRMNSLISSIFFIQRSKLILIQKLLKPKKLDVLQRYLVAKELLKK